MYLNFFLKYYFYRKIFFNDLVWFPQFKIKKIVFQFFFTAANKIKIYLHIIKKVKVNKEIVLKEEWVFIIDFKKNF